MNPVTPGRTTSLVPPTSVATMGSELGRRLQEDQRQPFPSRRHDEPVRRLHERRDIRAQTEQDHVAIHTGFANPGTGSGSSRGPRPAMSRRLAGCRARARANAEIMSGYALDAIQTADSEPHEVIAEAERGTRGRTEARVRVVRGGVDSVLDHEDPAFRRRVPSDGRPDRSPTAQRW